MCRYWVNQVDKKLEHVLDIGISKREETQVESPVNYPIVSQSYLNPKPFADNRSVS